MKTLALWLLLTPAHADECPANREPVGPINSGMQSNPGYKARAGGSYEEHHLAKATSQLVETARIGSQYEVVRCAITIHIYDWLDAYCRNNMERDDAKQKDLMAALDERLLPLIAPEHHAAYESWKASNPLNFLMTPPLTR